MRVEIFECVGSRVQGLWTKCCVTLRVRYYPDSNTVGSKDICKISHVNSSVR